MKQRYLVDVTERFADNFTGTYNLLPFSELYMSMSFYPG
jgi:hypothetical protein